jgi:DNA repair protein RecO (recombination protein O)
MASEKSLAVVLRLVPFSESSYVATLYTEDFGKITGLAKGARRSKSAFASALDLLSVCRIVFLSKSTDAMDLLTEASLERPFRSSIRNLSRLYAGYYALELVNALTDDRDPNRQLFRNLMETVIALDSGADVALHVLRFELMALRSLGDLPALYNCVECGTDVLPQRRIAFGQISGGVLCETCKIGKRHVVSLSREGLKTIQDLSEIEIMDWSSDSMKATGEVRMLMNRYMSHLLGRRPRMFDFMGFQ